MKVTDWEIQEEVKRLEARIKRQVDQLEHKLTLDFTEKTNGLKQLIDVLDTDKDQILIQLTGLKSDLQKIDLVVSNLSKGQEESRKMIDKLGGRDSGVTDEKVMQIESNIR